MNVETELGKKKLT